MLVFILENLLAKNPTPKQHQKKWNQPSQIQLVMCWTSETDYSVLYFLIMCYFNIATKNMY